MANVKVSDLPAASGLNTTDVTIVNQSGVTSQSTAGAAISTMTGFAPSGSGATSRTVQAKLRDWVSPEDFGAVGDGTTDDTAAINLALVQGPVKLSINRTYYIASTITMNAANMILFGEGSLKGNSAAAAQTAVIQITANNCEVRDISIDQNDIPTGRSIYINGADRAKIINVKNSNGQQNFVYVDGVSTNFTVESCENISRGYSVLVSTDAGASGAIIRGNRFINTEAAGTGDGIEFATTTNGFTDVVVEGNYISGMTGAASSAGIGIGLSNVQRATVANNVILDCENDGIHLEQGCSGITITGNVLNNCTTVSSGSAGAISLSGASTVVSISNNYVKDTAQRGSVTVTSGVGTFCTDVVIVGNVLDGATEFLISLESVKHCIVANNALLNANSSNTASVANIRVTKFTSNVCDSLTICGNTITGGTNASRPVAFAASSATGSEVTGNNFKNCSTRTVDLGSGNTVECHANRIGTDALSGTFTWGTAATKTVSNNNVDQQAWIAVWPTNAAAITLGQIYISSISRGTNFICTAPSSGAGTETYSYAIL